MPKYYIQLYFMPFSWYKLTIMAINNGLNVLKMNSIKYFLQRLMTAFNGFMTFIGYLFVSFNDDLIGF